MRESIFCISGQSGKCTIVRRLKVGLFLLGDGLFSGWFCVELICSSRGESETDSVSISVCSESLIKCW